MPLDPGFILTPVPGDLVIAADKGYETLSRLGVHPGLVVGDFDSLGSVPDHPQVLRLPRIKDETDTGFALRQGLKRGYRRFVLLGCLGGRLDHTVANLQLLSWLSAQGAQGVLLGEGEAAAVVTEGTLSFPASMEGFVSVFCAGGTARGVTLEELPFLGPDRVPTKREQFCLKRGKMQNTDKQETARDWICRALGIGSAESPLGKKFCAVFPMGTSIDNIADFREFIYQYILPQPELDLQLLQQEQIELDHLSDVLLQAKARAQMLTEIGQLGETAQIGRAHV